MKERKKHRKTDGSSLRMTVVILCLMIAAVVLFGAAIVKSRAGREEAAVPSESAAAQHTYWTTNVEVQQAGGIVIQHSHVPWGSPRRPGEVREIRRLVIHETDNRRSGADAEAHSGFLTGNTSDITAWHYTVDDHSIVHNIPDNEIAWNAGDQRSEDGGNMNGIGIELCVNLGNDYEQTLVNGAALAATLLRTYDLTPDDVRLHADFMDKVCPHRLITEGRVQEFYQMIRDDYEALSIAPSASAD